MINENIYKKYMIDRNQPLNKSDTEEQTYGCRAFNPMICKNCYGAQCGLTRKDHICKYPPRGWKKQYNYLKEKEANL